MDGLAQGRGGGSCLLDRQGYILACDAAFAATVGMPAEHCLGQRAVDLLPWLAPLQPGGAAHWVDPHHRLRATLTPLAAPAGSPIWALLSLGPASAFPEEMERAEALLDFLVGHMHDVVWVQDARTGAMLYVSPTYEDVWGTPRQRLYDDPTAYLQQVDPLDREQLRHVQDSPQEGAAAQEFRLLRPDGSQRWLRSRVFPMRDEHGALQRIATVVEDITLWRRTEIKLRRTHTTLQALIDASPVAILALDLKGHVILWNRAAERIFGFSAAQVLGRPYPIVPEQERASFVQLFARVIGGEGFTGVEARRLRSDGTLIDVSISTAPVRDETGQVVAAMALLQDISPRKQAERALAEELERRAALAAENERLYHEAREAVRLREEFISIASHELRTPCTSLHLAVQRLLHQVRKRPLAALPDSLVVGTLETAERQGRHLALLIDQLLEVSRIRAGRVELHARPTDLVQLVREVVADLQDQLTEAGCALTVRAEGPVAGTWDPLRLSQVVLNLLSNAIKYGAGRPIEVELSQRGGEATLLVRDAGIGIAPDRLASIFEPFERAVSPWHYGGLGLGLYIVRSLVQAMGGTIRVQSEPGAGATFTVTLPCAAAP